MGEIRIIGPGARGELRIIGPGRPRGELRIIGPGATPPSRTGGGGTPVLTHEQRTEIQFAQVAAEQEARKRIKLIKKATLNDNSLCVFIANSIWTKIKTPEFRTINYF